MSNAVSDRVRAILVDWLVEVCRKFKLLDDTLHLAVFLFDEYQKNNSVAMSEVQMTGCACTYIASKVEEVYCPIVQDFVYISCNSFAKDNFTAMEKRILKALNYDTMVCTLQSVSRSLKVSEDAQYFLDTVLLSSDILAKYDLHDIVESCQQMTSDSKNDYWSPCIQEIANFEETLTFTSVRKKHGKS